MKRLMRHLVLFSAAIFLVASDAQSGEGEKKHTTPTILVSFDGVQPGVIDQLLKSGKLSKTAVSPQ